MLAAVAGLGATGCLGRRSETVTDSPTTRSETTSDPTTPTDTATPTDTETATDTETPTETPLRFTIEGVSEIPRDESVVVYPPSLRSLLREAARTGDTLREAAGTFSYSPVPVLPTVETVELVSDDETAGTYRITGDGGTRYQLQAGAERATPPADATVTPVGDLTDPRRELAVAAITGEDAGVYPETRLGEWARTSFFGSYVAYDGQTYRGHERKQTDAAFFSRQVWYIVSLSPVETAADPLRIRLDPVPSGVRQLLDPYFDTRTEAKPLVANDPAVRAFVGDDPYLLTHTGRVHIRSD